MQGFTIFDDSYMSDRLNRAEGSILRIVTSRMPRLQRKGRELACRHGSAAQSMQLRDATRVIEVHVRVENEFDIFDPEADIGAIKAKAYPPRHAAFRGEMMRHVMGCLRMATEPLTSRDIATVVMKGRGLNPDDAELAVTIRKRVGACMWKLKQSGYARETKIAGELKGWIRVE